MPDVLHFNAPDSTGCGTENDPRPPHRLSRTGQCERTALLRPAHCALKHTQVRPPALAFVPPSFIPFSSGIFPRHPDSSFILASNFCACPLPQALCILRSSPLTAFSLSFWVSLSLSLSHSLISVSQFLILRLSQTRSQQPHWGETILLGQQKSALP